MRDDWADLIIAPIFYRFNNGRIQSVFELIRPGVYRTREYAKSGRMIYDGFTKKESPNGYLKNKRCGEWITFRKNAAIKMHRNKQTKIETPTLHNRASMIKDNPTWLLLSDVIECEDRNARFELINTKSPII